MPIQDARRAGQVRDRPGDAPGPDGAPDREPEPLHGPTQDVPRAGIERRNACEIARGEPGVPARGWVSLTGKRPRGEDSLPDRARGLAGSREEEVLHRDGGNLDD